MLGGGDGFYLAYIHAGFGDVAYSCKVVRGALWVFYRRDRHININF